MYFFHRFWIDFLNRFRNYFINRFWINILIMIIVIIIIIDFFNRFKNSESVEKIQLKISRNFESLEKKSEIWMKNLFLQHFEIDSFALHIEKSFRSLFKSNQNQIVFTIFRLIWNSKRTVSVCCSKLIGKW